MNKYIFYLLLLILGGFVAIKLATKALPYLLLAGGVYVGYRWLDKKLALKEEKQNNENEAKGKNEIKEEIKEVEVKVIDEKPASLEERINRLKEDNV